MPDMESFARHALTAYDIEVRHLRSISTDWNATFRVETADGVAYALRVYLASRRTDDEVRSELEWLEALGTVSQVNVPRPLRSRDGSLFVRAEDEDGTEQRRVAIFTWIPGAPLGDEPDPALVAAFGEATARLHEHGRTFGSVEGLRTWDSPFIHGERSLLDPNADVIEPPDRRVFELAATAARAEIARLAETTERPRILHGDLHHDNVFAEGDDVWILDFDDCLLGWPVQDLGVTMWEVGEDQATWPYRDAFRAGYERVALWPERRPGQIDVFAANRGLLKADDAVRESVGVDLLRARSSVRRHADAIAWFLERDGST
jgi:Ser/Thr protein kinase RdoA (MazF antagonist)